jgi:hypothetical protein
MKPLDARRTDATSAAGDNDRLASESGHSAFYLQLHVYDEDDVSRAMARRTAGRVEARSSCSFQAGKSVVSNSNRFAHRAITNPKASTTEKSSPHSHPLDPAAILSSSTRFSPKFSIPDCLMSLFARSSLLKRSPRKIFAISVCSN